MSADLMVSTTISCTRLSGTTMLLTWNDKTLLTNPQGTLPPCHVSVVLLSRVHRTTIDFESFRFISGKVHVIVPEGTGDRVAKLLSNPVMELAHFASYTFNGGLDIMALPMGRPAWGFFARKQNGYLLRSNDQSLLFCGDARRGKHFRELGNLQTVDIALVQQKTANSLHTAQGAVGIKKIVSIESLAQGRKVML